MPRYQLTVSVEGLPSSFWTGRKPNPYAVVTVTGGDRKGSIVGTTETIQWTTNPKFTQTLFVECDSTLYIPIQIAIHDHQGYSTLPSRNPKIAAANFEVSEVHRNPGHCTMHTCIHNPNIKIFASVEESQKGTEDPSSEFQFQIRGLELKNAEFGFLGLNRSDPFYEISKKVYDHNTGYVNWIPVVRSEYIKSHLNPLWNPHSISLEEICYCDLSWPLKITVYDDNGTKPPKPMSEIETRVSDLLAHVAVRGNADRERALRLHEITDRPSFDEIYGYIVVLSAVIVKNSKS